MTHFDDHDPAQAADRRTAQRQRWYAEAPECACGGRVSVARACVGFFGLSITYWNACDGCLPPDVADESRRIKAALLEADGGAQTSSPGAGVNMPRDRMAQGALDSRPVADAATSGDRRTDCMSTMPIATAPRSW